MLSPVPRWLFPPGKACCSMMGYNIDECGDAGLQNKCMCCPLQVGGEIGDAGLDNQCMCCPLHSD